MTAASRSVRGYTSLNGWARVLGSSVGLHLAGKDRVLGTGIALNLAVDDIAAVHRRVKDAGAAVTDPVPQPWGATMCKLTDLDGHVWSLV